MSWNSPPFLPEQNGCSFHHSPRLALTREVTQAEKCVESRGETVKVSPRNGHGSFYQNFRVWDSLSAPGFSPMPGEG